MTLPIWRERPQEDAHLFNPAFCGAITYEFTSSFLKTSKLDEVHLALVFCALPIVLHKTTRESLPDRTVTSVYTWLQRTPEALVGYSTRAANLSPYLKEAVSFCVSRNTLDFSNSGQLILGAEKSNFTPRKFDELTYEMKDIVTRTRMLGRWFSGAGETATIMAAWGITV
jgi:hypothetical protein